MLPLQFLIRLVHFYQYQFIYKVQSIAFKTCYKLIQKPLRTLDRQTNLKLILIPIHFFQF
jgi:hypothetical protein